MTIEAEILGMVKSLGQAWLIIDRLQAEVIDLRTKVKELENGKSTEPVSAPED